MIIERLTPLLLAAIKLILFGPITLLFLTLAYKAYGKRQYILVGVYLVGILEFWFGGPWLLDQLLTYIARHGAHH